MTPELKEKMEKQNSKFQNSQDLNEWHKPSLARGFGAGAEAMFKELEPRLKELEDEQYWHRELKKDFNKQVLKCADLEIELEEFREENTNKVMKLKTAREALEAANQYPWEYAWRFTKEKIDSALKSLKGESV